MHVKLLQGTEEDEQLHFFFTIFKWKKIYYPSIIWEGYIVFQNMPHKGYQLSHQQISMEFLKHVKQSMK